MAKIEHQILHRLISNHLIAVIPNYFIGAYECDLFTLNKNLYTTEYEIKKTVADFKRDMKKNNSRWIFQSATRETYHKHEAIKAGSRTNRFYFVIPEELLDKVEIPNYAGLITFTTSKYGLWLATDTIKRAPRLHNRTADDKMLRHIIGNLNYRHYSLIFQQMKGTINENHS